MEDDEDTRALIAVLFPDDEVRAVGTVAEALRLAQAGWFDLYLLDAWLPDGDGVELCRQLRAFDPNTPVIFISGAAYDSDRRQALEAGAQLYLVKPVDIFAPQDAVVTLIRKADLHSLDAKLAEVAAIRDEIADLLEAADARVSELEAVRDRIADRLQAALRGSGRVREAGLRPLRDGLKGKAFRAFTEAGGSRADFERLWPEVREAELPQQSPRLASQGPYAGAGLPG